MVPKDIVNCLFNSAHFAISNDHLSAFDSYLEIAIGNKAWTVGINLLGVHERTGKSRLFVTYILRFLKRSFK